MELDDESVENVDDGIAADAEAQQQVAAHASRIRVTLWRRDMLTGVVELDEDLVVRRASPMTGLIVGVPSTAMLKKPLQRYGAL